MMMIRPPLPWHSVSRPRLSATGGEGVEGGEGFQPWRGMIAGVHSPSIAEPSPAPELPGPVLPRIAVAIGPGGVFSSQGGRRLAAGEIVEVIRPLPNLFHGRASPGP